MNLPVRLLALGAVCSFERKEVRFNVMCFMDPIGDAIQARLVWLGFGVGEACGGWESVGVPGNAWQGALSVRRQVGTRRRSPNSTRRPNGALRLCVTLLGSPVIPAPFTTQPNSYTEPGGAPPVQ